MTNKKLCPLKKITEYSFGYCDKEKCAWYDTTKEICAIWLIADEIRKLRWRLEDGVVVIKP